MFPFSWLFFCCCCFWETWQSRLTTDFLFCRSKVLDYTQYYLNLTEANANGRAEWRRAYNFTQLYNMPDVNPIALHNVASAMLTHPNVFQNYYTVNHMLRDGLPYCGSLCRQVHFCSATQIDYADYDDCIVKALMASSSRSSGATSNWTKKDATWRLFFIVITIALLVVNGRLWYFGTCVAIPSLQLMQHSIHSGAVCSGLDELDPFFPPLPYWRIINSVILDINKWLVYGRILARSKQINCASLPSPTNGGKNQSCHLGLEAFLVVFIFRRRMARRAKMSWYSLNKWIFVTVLSFDGLPQIDSTFRVLWLMGRHAITCCILLYITPGMKPLPDNCSLIQFTERDARKSNPCLLDESTNCRARR